MPTKTIRDLRHKYKVAYTAYMSCVHALSDAGLRGEVPGKEILERERRAFDDIAETRKALLRALAEYEKAQ